MTTLKERLNQQAILIAPGAYDALTSALIEQAGFEAMYLSGASIAYSRLGKPDVGLVSLSEVADTLTTIRERIEIPIIIDADTGFGNTLNVIRTVKLLENIGANAIQIEDQQLPKRCGHLKGKTLVSQEEMSGKIKAAVDTRLNDETLIIARTDAIAVTGFDDALKRAESYIDAGADVLFIEAPETDEQLQLIGESFSQRIPLLANMIEGGNTPIQNASQLQALGFSMTIYPGAMVRVLSHAAQNYLRCLREDGDTLRLKDSMHDLQSLNKLLQTDAILAEGKRYEG